MEVCELCGQAKEKAYSCMKRMDRQIPFTNETNAHPLPEYCPECHVGMGGFHHVGCSIEQCPECNGQVSVCMCRDVAKYHILPSKEWWIRLPRAIREDVFTG